MIVGEMIEWEDEQLFPGKRNSRGGCGAGIDVKNERRSL